MKKHELGVNLSAFIKSFETELQKTNQEARSLMTVAQERQMEFNTHHRDDVVSNSIQPLRIIDSSTVNKL